MGNFLIPRDPGSPNSWEWNPWNQKVPDAFRRKIFNTPIISWQSEPGSLGYQSLTCMFRPFWGGFPYLGWPTRRGAVMYISLKTNCILYSISSYIISEQPTIRNPLWHFDQLYPPGLPNHFPPVPDCPFKTAVGVPSVLISEASSLGPFVQKPVPPVFFFDRIHWGGSLHIFILLMEDILNHLTCMKTLQIKGYLPYQLVHDSFHQQDVHVSIYKRKHTKAPYRYKKFFSELIYPKRCWQGCCENVFLAYPPEDGDWFLRCTECMYKKHML